MVLEKGCKKLGYMNEIKENKNANQPIVAQIEALVDKNLAAKHPVSPMASHPSTRGEYPQTDTSHWEREIDRLVYQLYGLTDDEIKIIEGQN